MNPEKMRNGPDRLRALNAPHRVTVELDANGQPIGMRDAGCGMRRAVETIGEVWRIDVEWWRLSIVGGYWEVIFEGGGRDGCFLYFLTGDGLGWWPVNL